MPKEDAIEHSVVPIKPRAHVLLPDGIREELAEAIAVCVRSANTAHQALAEDAGLTPDDMHQEWCPEVRRQA